MKTAKAIASLRIEDEYAQFESLDGRHPWQDQVPEGMILYRVRKLNEGKVSYFNFDLAKEMGLIAPNHPHRLTRKLSDTILNTFCLRIINEYDQKRKTHFASPSIKDGSYMATRYLQMQHADKTGRTSGDGRCIWNGTVSANGVIWDVSSRGTGVTALAPGVVEAGQPLKSGNRDHGYGCGMAENDELFGAAICAEIFHRNAIPTERMLAIIDLGKGMGIGVRAAPNLIRPAHLFMFLKQGRLEPLRRAADYLIDRQRLNKVWNIKPSDKDRYKRMLEEVTKAFAHFVARLDRDYIFAWLEWDGDNVLADAGIIDYGSVRQFGLRHDQYRYDDVERFSTNLNEQRLKARDLVQTYAQLVDFLESGEKKPWRSFSSSPSLKAFDQEFHDHSLERLLYQVGFSTPIRRLLMNRHRKDVESFFAIHSAFERVKTTRKMRRVADGIHRPAIFNMRQALAQMALHMQTADVHNPIVPADTFFTWILSSQTSRQDRKLSARLRYRILIWQECYLRLVENITTPPTRSKTLRAMRERSDQINHEARMTGNALIHIVDELLRHRRRGLSDTERQVAIEQLIAAQTLNPDFVSGPARKTPGSRAPSLVRQFLNVLHGFREDI